MPTPQSDGNVLQRLNQLEKQIEQMRRTQGDGNARTATPNSQLVWRIAQTKAVSGSYPQESENPNVYPIVFVDGKFTAAQGQQTVTYADRQTDPDSERVVCDLGGGYIAQGTKILVYRQNGRWWTGQGIGGGGEAPTLPCKNIDTETAPDNAVLMIVGYAPNGITTTVNLTNSIFTTATPHGWTTPQEVLLHTEGGYLTTTPPTTDYTTSYWAKVLGPTTCTLHPTQADAIAGTNALLVTSLGQVTSMTLGDINAGSYFKISKYRTLPSNSAGGSIWSGAYYGINAGGPIASQAKGTMYFNYFPPAIPVSVAFKKSDFDQNSADNPYFADSLGPEPNSWFASRNGRGMRCVGASYKIGSDWTVQVMFERGPANITRDPDIVTAQRVKEAPNEVAEQKVDWKPYTAVMACTNSGMDGRGWPVFCYQKTQKWTSSGVNSLQWNFIQFGVDRQTVKWEDYNGSYGDQFLAQRGRRDPAIFVAGDGDTNRSQFEAGDPAGPHPILPGFMYPGMPGPWSYSGERYHGALTPVPSGWDSTRDSNELYYFYNVGWGVQRFFGKAISKWKEDSAESYMPYVDCWVAHWKGKYQPSDPRSFAIYDGHAPMYPKCKVRVYLPKNNFPTQGTAWNGKDPNVQPDQIVEFMIRFPYARQVPGSWTDADPTGTAIWTGAFYAVGDYLDDKIGTVKLWKNGIPTIPKGWRELTQAQGRFAVGPGGTLGAAVMQQGGTSSHTHTMSGSTGNAGSNAPRTIDAATHIPPYLGLYYIERFE